MSRAVELAKECGSRVSFSGLSGNPTITITFSSEQLEAFYHAARAEALREAANVCDSIRDRYNICEGESAKECEEAIRAMADREWK